LDCGLFILWVLIVIALLGQFFQFLHVYFGGELVFSVFEVDEFLDGDSLGDFLDEVGVEAVHVDGQPHHVRDVRLDELHALLHQLLHPQEVRTYQYGDHILQVELGLVVVLQVLHEPLEDLDVAVDGDVDVVQRLRVLQVLLKVLHL